MDCFAPRHFIEKFLLESSHYSSSHNKILQGKKQEYKKYRNLTPKGVDLVRMVLNYFIKYLSNESPDFHTQTEI